MDRAERDKRHERSGTESKQRSGDIWGCDGSSERSVPVRRYHIMKSILKNLPSTLDEAVDFLLDIIPKR
jgi:hypothetical protein